MLGLKLNHVSKRGHRLGQGQRLNENELAFRVADDAARPAVLPAWYIERYHQIPDMFYMPGHVIAILLLIVIIGEFFIANI